MFLICRSSTTTRTLIPRASDTPRIAPLVPQGITECFEFLPTSDYVGFAGVNASPLSLHMRLTARDGKGGRTADTTLPLATNAGPFPVSLSPNAAATGGGSTRTVRDPANTNVAPRARTT